MSVPGGSHETRDGSPGLVAAGCSANPAPGPRVGCIFLPWTAVFYLHRRVIIRRAQRKEKEPVKSFVEEILPNNDASFNQLIDLALAQEFKGWDFSWLNERTEEEPLPWDYETIASGLLKNSQAVLDVDTGGGEVFSRLGPYPMVAWATEGYPPNIPLARSLLEPLGVQVADVSELSGLMPFINHTFDLVLNRHGGLYADEIERILQPGGRYFTQQVGGENYIELNRTLQENVSFEYSHCTLEYNVAQLKKAGLEIVQAREVFTRTIFHDIAGIVFYLKVIPWQIADFNVEKYRDRLLRIHQAILNDGGFTVHEHLMLIEAVKPPDFDDIA